MFNRRRRSTIGPKSTIGTLTYPLLNRLRQITHSDLTRRSSSTSQVKISLFISTLMRWATKTQQIISIRPADKAIERTSPSRLPISSFPRSKAKSNQQCRWSLRAQPSTCYLPWERDSMLWPWSQIRTLMTRNYWRWLKMRVAQKGKMVIKLALIQRRK